MEEGAEDVSGGGELRGVVVADSGERASLAPGTLETAPLLRGIWAPTPLASALPLCTTLLVLPDTEVERGAGVVTSSCSSARATSIAA